MTIRIASYGLSKGTLTLEEQQFGPWIWAPQFNPAKKTIIEVQGYEVSRKLLSRLGKDTTGVAVSDHMRLIQGLVEEEGLVGVPNCD